MKLEPPLIFRRGGKGTDVPFSSALFFDQRRFAPHGTIWIATSLRALQ
ncbi:MAG: hypothetical protein LBE06_04790 [Azoarcus sp.]|nr:hypothetical protein [Azoarcus sp.]